MEKDNYIVNNGEKDIEIYPILEVNFNNKNYLIYTMEVKENYTREDLYVGEETEDKILPVDNHLLPVFDNFLDSVIKKLPENQ